MRSISTLLLLLLSSVSALAQNPVAPEKLSLAKSIWEPSFREVKYSDLIEAYDAYRAAKGISTPRAIPSQERFEMSKELVYETLAEVLTESDLELQRRMFQTAVGARTLSNVARVIGGLPALPIAQDQFTQAQWTEWETFVFTNSAHMGEMQKRMSAFPQTLAAKSARLPPLVPDDKK
jgi:hypothetical protein